MNHFGNGVVVMVVVVGGGGRFIGGSVGTSGLLIFVYTMENKF